MYLKVKKSFCRLLLPIILLSGCKENKVAVEQKVISIEHLRKAVFDTSGEYSGYMSVQILKTYPIQMNCTTNVQYANLYICKKRLTKSDIIYVFDECEQPPDFALDTGMNIETGIFARDTLKNSTKKVTVFVPKAFRMHKNAIYIFAKLTGTIL